MKKESGIEGYLNYKRFIFITNTRISQLQIYVQSN